MEFFQTIWTALTTPNEGLITILSIPVSFIEVFTNMLLFTTILNIKCSNKIKLIYVISVSIVAAICRLFIPDPYATFINIINIILFTKFVLKTTFLKSLLAEFIAIAFSSIMEWFIFKFYLGVFNIHFESIMTVPLYRLSLTFSIYLCIYLIYKIVQYFKFNIDLENMTKRNKILFFINTFFGILAIATQFYLLVFYSNTMPIIITIASIISFLAYFFISIYSLLSTNKLDTTSRDLEEAQLYNKTLNILHDSMRTFKHDFNNIVQGIGGYAERADLDGLKKYYKQLLEECGRVNNLTALNPDVINNPAIYNIMAAKYHRADEMGIQINLTILMNLNEIEKQMKIFEFTRILGILMDNAIEASCECDNKIINVTFRNEKQRHRLLMIIENSYLNKDINIDRIYEKAYSTKSNKTNSGLGLWEVRQILKKYNNLNLFTTKNKDFFVQQFEIYY